jgi:hypothetical protein
LKVSSNWRLLRLRTQPRSGKTAHLMRLLFARPQFEPELLEASSASVIFAYYSRSTH